MKTKSSSNSSRPSGNTKKARQIACSKHWCFTLNNYKREDIEEFIGSSSIAKYVFQEETGEQGTMHLQGYIEFKDKCRPMSILKNKSIHWEKCRNVKASIAYCSKEETKSGERFIKNIAFEEPLKLLKEDMLYDWQKDILEEIKKEPDDRIINFVWEKTGCTGKSALCKLLCAKYGALCVSGKSADIKYGIVKHKEEHRVYPKIILIDVPRCNIDYINYEAIEKVKDGLFFCGKYESTQVIMNSPHIFVFMNEHPDITKLSKDRYKIIKL